MTMNTLPGLRLIDWLLRLFYGAISMVGPRLQVLLLRPIMDWLHRRPDHWGFDSSPYERRRLVAALQASGSGPFQHCLEVACSEGAFTELLAGDPKVKRITATDVSPRAVARARARLAGQKHVEVRFDNLAGESDLGGPYDLVYCMEVLYYAGAARAIAARRLARVLAPGGRLVLVHPASDAPSLHRPFLEQPELRPISITVFPDPVRPVEICVLTRA